MSPTHPVTRPTAPHAADQPKNLSRRKLTQTLRRLAHTAMFAAVRGLAYALGTAAGTALVSLAWWWITSR
ncbi:hypothetical protein [Actinomadura sp. GTD37]|uniref:hypothetical protein n=1 Tax=Actinomadura sp. GTD37 TaxID=1778030 RepID=UPI0035C1344F